MPKSWTTNKSVRIELPVEIHGGLKSRAALANKTLAEWIISILAKSVKQQPKEK